MHKMDRAQKANNAKRATTVNPMAAAHVIATAAIVARALRVKAVTAPRRRKNALLWVAKKRLLPATVNRLRALTSAMWLTRLLQAPVRQKPLLRQRTQAHRLWQPRRPLRRPARSLCQQLQSPHRRRQQQPLLTPYQCLRLAHLFCR